MKYTIALFAITILLFSSLTTAVSCPTNSYNFKEYCTCADGTKEFIDHEDWKELRKDFRSCCYVPPLASNLYQKRTDNPDGTFVVEWSNKPLELITEPSNTNPPEPVLSNGVRHEVIDDPAVLKQIQLERAKAQRKAVFENQLIHEDISHPLQLFFIYLTSNL